MAIVVGGVFLSRTAFAHDPPPMLPTRVDFDATQAPKSCHDNDEFSTILSNWVTAGTVTPDADRRLVVRIRRSQTGGKLVDVTLLDADGSTLGEEHKAFPRTAECHKVLYESALTAARLMGAFQKRPPPEPISCPDCPVCPEPAECPSHPAAVPPPPPPPIAASVAPKPPPASSARHAFIGAGVFFGRNLASEWDMGPLVPFGFVLSPRAPQFQVELEGAWVPQRFDNGPATNAVPLFGSLCYSPSILRMCSGIATTFLDSSRDDIHLALAATLRLGTEFTIAGPLSIRWDAYTLLPLWQRTNGPEWAKLDASASFALGTAALGVLSFN